MLTRINRLYAWAVFRTKVGRQVPLDVLVELAEAGVDIQRFV